MARPGGVILAWRDDGGTLRRRWFKTQSEADHFKEHVTGAPGALDYLSDILGELEAHRAELEGIRAVLEQIAEQIGGA
jgi:hypothetical protein